MDDGRAKYRELARGNWTSFLWLASQKPHEPNSLDEGDTHLEAERDVGDLLTRYVFIWDARDLEGCVSLFTEDVVRGTFEGREAVYANYQGMAMGKEAGEGEGSLHRPVNILINVEPGLKQAWLASYWHVVTQVRSLLGNYFMRLTNTDDGWRIADCRIAWDFYSQHERPTEPYPTLDSELGEPTSPEPAFDWTGRGEAEAFSLGAAENE